MKYSLEFQSHSFPSTNKAILGSWIVGYFRKHYFPLQLWFVKDSRACEYLPSPRYFGNGRNYFLWRQTNHYSSGVAQLLECDFKRPLFTRHLRSHSALPSARDHSRKFLKAEKHTVFPNWERLFFVLFGQDFLCFSCGKWSDTCESKSSCRVNHWLSLLESPLFSSVFRGEYLLLLFFYPPDMLLNFCLSG